MNGKASLEIAAPADVVYDLIADVTRMGEWSPECYRCEWIDGATRAAVGARFKGYNRSGLIHWSNRSKITRAERGHVLSWAMGPAEAPYSAWQYTFEATPGGVLVIETFESLRRTRLGRLSMLPMGGQRRSEKRLQLGMQRTLERLRAAAEAQSGQS